MKFTITGTQHGRPASVTWEDGKLSGDKFVIQDLMALAGDPELLRSPPAIDTVQGTGEIPADPITVSAILMQRDGFFGPYAEYDGDPIIDDPDSDPDIVY